MDRILNKIGQILDAVLIVGTVSIVILGIVVLNFAASENNKYHDAYMTIFRVEEIEDENAFLLDSNGHEWIWELEGNEEWGIDDYVAALMDDNKTTNIYDDIIMKIEKVKVP